jgi:L-arginine dehydrogenase
VAGFPGGTGDFITYLGVLEEARVFGAKLSPYINRPDGAIITAWTSLMSMDTGRPLLLCDSKQLTTERTAATTALAVEQLAWSRARILAVIGTGEIARAHVRHVAGMRDWDEIRFFSPTLMERTDTHDALLSLDHRVELFETLDGAVRDADVVMLCTSSPTPVLDPADLTRSALITSIGTNAPGAHEVPAISLLSMDVYCDDRGSTPLAAGEMLIAADEYGWSADDIVGDLGDLLTGRAARPDPDTHTFFRSVGLGVEDVAMAAAILALARHDDASR